MNSNKVKGTENKYIVKLQPSSQPLELYRGTRQSLLTDHLLPMRLGTTYSTVPTLFLT